MDDDVPRGEINQSGGQCCIRCGRNIDAVSIDPIFRRPLAWEKVCTECRIDQDKDVKKREEEFRNVHQLSYEMGKSAGMISQYSK